LRQNSHLELKSAKYSQLVGSVSQNCLVLIVVLYKFITFSCWDDDGNDDTIIIIIIIIIIILKWIFRKWDGGHGLD
jgi:hypothetical protein